MTMTPKGLKRLAIALRRQDPDYDLQQAHRCDFYSYDSSGAIIGACVLGKIALEFFGAEKVWESMHADTEPEVFISNIWREAGLPQKMEVLHPLSQMFCDLTDTLIGLNNDEQWSFSDIADWLEREANRLYLASHSLAQLPLPIDTTQTESE